MFFWVTGVPNLNDDFGAIAAGMLVWVVLLLVIGVLESVFLGLCVYNDARLRQNENAALWGVLSGVFGIGALIYLIVAMSSKNQPTRCLRCGNFLYPGMPACPVCGQPAPVLPLEAAETYRKRRTRYLVLWIVMIALTVILGIVFGFFFVQSMVISNVYRYY